MTLLLIILILLTVVFKATGDAFRWVHKMKLHHLFQSLTWLVFGVIIYLINFYSLSSREFWHMVVLLVAWRFFAYDYICNLVSGKWKTYGIGYLGMKGSSIYADLLYWIEEKTKFDKAAGIANTLKWLIALPIVVTTIIKLL